MSGILPNKKKKYFSILFDRYYANLYRYAFKVLRGKDMSEELVQETFIKLWEHIENINDDNRSIESYLMITLKNKIIDLQRKTQARQKHTNHFTLHQEVEIEMDEKWDLNQQIHAIYSSLDEKTKDIFLLSREKGLSYKEIALKKNVSIKTVESYISKALSAFRKGLKDYL